MPTLYGSPISFFVNKVRYVLNALEIDYDFQQLNLMAGEHKKADYLEKHPAGKIPCIQDGDLNLFESNAIIKYYSDLHNSSFYPKDLKARAKVDQWMDFSSIHISGGMTRVAFNTLFAPIMPGTKVDEESLRCGREFLAKYLPIVDEQLAKSKYLAADEITVADFNLIATLDPAEAAQIDLSQYANITKWRNELMKESWYTKCHDNFSDLLLKMTGSMAK